MNSDSVIFNGICEADIKWTHNVKVAVSVWGCNGRLTEIYCFQKLQDRAARIVTDISINTLPIN